VWIDACNCSCLVLCISNSDWATEKEAGRSVSVHGNEEPRCRELSPMQFSCNCNYSLITHNKTPVHSAWGLLRVCAACPTPPRLQAPYLREQHPRQVPHRVRAGYNTVTCCHVSSLLMVVHSAAHRQQGFCLQKTFCASERLVLLTTHHLQRPAEVFHVLLWRCHRV